MMQRIRRLRMSRHEEGSNRNTIQVPSALTDQAWSGLVVARRECEALYVPPRLMTPPLLSPARSATEAASSWSHSAQLTASSRIQHGSLPSCTLATRDA